VILPSKHLPPERALLAVGARILRALNQPKTVTQLWNELRGTTITIHEAPTYDWFVLALDLLYVVGAIAITRGRLSRSKT